MPYEYEKNGQAIYDESFTTIRREADLAQFDADEEQPAPPPGCAQPPAPGAGPRRRRPA